MNKLPSETLSLVFSSLAKKDQLVCLRVSNRWKGTVGDNLYKDLHFDSAEKFHQAYLLFDSNKDLGKVVTQLGFEKCDLSPFLIFSLPNLFSNIKHLKWQENDYFKPQNATISELGGTDKAVLEHLFGKWKKQIVHILIVSLSLFPPVPTTTDQLITLNILIV